MDSFYLQLDNHITYYILLFQLKNNKYNKITLFLINLHLFTFQMPINHKYILFIIYII